MAKVYFAHSGNDHGLWNPLAKHLSEVADRARRFAAAFDCGDSAHSAGLLHDLGKYGDLFQPIDVKRQEKCLRALGFFPMFPVN